MNLVKNNTRAIIIGALLLLIILLIGGILWKSFPSDGKNTEDVRLVRTQVVHTSNGSQCYQYSGEVHSRYESNLAFQTSGKIIRRNVEVGSSVQAGDVLMQLDPHDAQQTVETYAAEIARAESQYRLALNSLQRCHQLYAQGAVSKVELEQAQNNCDTAAAALRQLNAQYALSQAQLDYTTLRADQDGVITGIHAEVGQVLVSSASAQTVVTIAQNENLEVEINVPENRLETLKQAQSIKVCFWALPDVVLDGQVRLVAPMADQVTKTFKVRISLLNPPPDLKLGMTSTVSIDVVDKKSAGVYIPLSAIYQTGNAPSVWVVTNDVAHLRSVKVDSLSQDQVLIKEGLQAGDQVVTAGVHKLIEGQKVRTEDTVS